MTHEPFEGGVAGMPEHTGVRNFAGIPVPVDAVAVVVPPIMAVPQTPTMARKPIAHDPAVPPQSASEQQN